MFEMFELTFMVYAFIACLIMSVMLSYLGIHVVARGIVFVDLAIGQISYLGIAFAGFMGWNEISVPIIFTLVGSVVLSFIRIRDKRLKLEAIIGIFYAVSSALTVLFISKTPHGEADIQEVLFGNLLGVTQGDLIKMGVVFGTLAVLHMIWYRRIFQITHEYENHQLKGGRSFLLWNIFFYLSIGLAIVFAIELGGVIPVFSFIIVPPVIAVILVKKESFVVVATLLCAIITSYFGLYFSYRWDFPTGASIVTTLGVLVLIAGTVKFIRSLVVHQEQRV
ncbi:MAG: metal ABC transporter permease [Candidatus Marinimicrobia bacterium]|nr:metal ABC transporter permease [Candidatus Neomarinimicrobiota bacterium]MCH8068082.1 metal ABC transporter permease [Candidatus Neomarinimicrobiota bacterium]